MLQLEKYCSGRLDHVQFLRPQNMNPRVRFSGIEFAANRTIRYFMVTTSVRCTGELLPLLLFRLQAWLGEILPEDRCQPRIPKYRAINHQSSCVNDLARSTELDDAQRIPTPQGNKLPSPQDSVSENGQHPVECFTYQPGSPNEVVVSWSIGHRQLSS